MIKFIKKRESQDILSFNKLIVEECNYINIFNINKSIIIEINIYKVI